tara:strand:+ start:321 stop:596 length:276 start_codon:yes stop_codon:yes gene_type:complete
MTFKDIIDFPNYQVNENGEILNVRSGRLLKPCVSSNKQVRIGLRRDGISFNRSIHRIMAIAFIPNPRELWFVQHLDGDKTNNIISNLKWVN